MRRRAGGGCQVILSRSSAPRTQSFTEHALAKRWLALTEAKRIIAGLLPADPVEDCNEWNDGNLIEARAWLAAQEANVAKKG